MATTWLKYACISIKLICFIFYLKLAASSSLQRTSNDTPFARQEYQSNCYKCNNHSLSSWPMNRETGARSAIDLPYTKHGSTRIAHGYRVEPGQFPFQVRLLFRVDKDGAKSCGGVIIDKRNVLTAAHCVTDATCVFDPDGQLKLPGPDDIILTVGDLDVSKPDGETEVWVNRVIVHENFCAPHTQWLESDIALIQTADDIKFVQTPSGYGSVDKIRLPDRNRNYKVGQKFAVSGWGLTEHNKTSNHLMWVEIELADNKKCAKLFGPDFLPASQLCFQNFEHREACPGDSGGPVFGQDKSGNFMLVGLVSYGRSTKCGKTSLPKVSTKVAAFLDWINDNRYV